MRTAFVSGCSGGLGLAVAHALRRRGLRVFAGCRRHEDCERRRAEGFDSPQVDHADLDGVRAAVSHASDASGGALDLLVANAASGAAGPIEHLGADGLADVFDANLFGHQAAIEAAVPRMRRAGGGRVVVVSSILGVDCLAYLGAYQMTKHALEGVAAALRAEEADRGIDVTVVRPGPIATGIRGGAAAHAARWRERRTGAAHHDAWDEIERRLTATGGSAKVPFELSPHVAAEKIATASVARRAPRVVRVGVPAYVLAVAAVAPMSVRDRLRRALSR